MYRLDGCDANFLYQDTPTAPMHTLKIFLLEVAEGASLNMAGITSRLEGVLNISPMLRQRPVFVPFGLHHPVMIEDPDFDLDYHICRAALPAPGGMRELEEMIAQIASHPLDHQRPLWELWLLDGLVDGRVACVQKIHHTLADGMGSLRYMTRSWNDQGYDQSAKPDWVPEQIPSGRRLVWDALVDHIRHDVGNLPGMIRDLYRSARNMMAHSKHHSLPTLKGLSGELPRCRWNRALSPKRSFATAQLSLDQMRELKSEIGGTINDVIMGLCAGSLRNYLIHHEELPNQPLLVSIPVSTDEAGTEREFGNRVTAMTTSLHVNIADPLKRYQATLDSTRDGARELEAMGRMTWGQLLQYTPPALSQWLSRRKYRQRKASNPKYRPPSNLVISNVPGPREPLRASDNLVSDLYSIGPLLDGLGLNITVWSYAGKLNFSILGCKKHLPDVSLIADGISTAMRELQLAAENNGK